MSGGRGNLDQASPLGTKLCPFLLKVCGGWEKREKKRDEQSEGRGDRSPAADGRTGEEESEERREQLPYQLNDKKGK